jgi:hypothetical protein
MFGLAMLTACSKSDFIQEIQGTWAVTKISYNYADTVLTITPTQMTFIFNNTNYQSLVNGEVAETGTFQVNLKATQIHFFSDLGNRVFLIQQKTSQHQAWVSKNKIVDFYLGFELEKIE